MNTNYYLDRIAKKLISEGGSGSDYALAKAIGITRQAISRYRKGHGGFDDEVAIRVAQILDLPPAQVLVDVMSERTNSPEVRRILRDLVKQMGRAAVAVLTLGTMAYVTVGMSYSPSVEASEGSVRGGNTYYVKRRIARVRAALMRWLGIQASTSRLVLT